jgi:hypothetical protein
VVSLLAMAFWGAAAVLQLALAAVLLRRRLEPWRLPAGIHLAVNGAAAALALAELTQGGRLLAGSAHFRMHDALDTATACLVLWTALSFPALPGRWGRPGLLGPLCLLPLAAYGALLAFGVPLQAGAAPQASASWAGTLLVRSLPVAAWTVLVARWGLAVARGRLPASSLPVFGAYAVRGAHMGLLIPALAAVRWQGPAAAPFLLLVAPLLVAHLAVLAAAMAALARRCFGTAGGPARVAFGFLAFGCLEALVSLGPALVHQFPDSPLANLDLFVLRPLLLGWAALSGERLLAPGLHRLAVGACGLAGTLSLAAGFELALPSALPVAGRAALSVVAAAVAVAGLLALLAPLLRRSEAEPAAIEGFLREAEEAHAAGFPPGSRARLDAAAARLGLPPAQARALETAVGTGWSAQQAWVPGQRVRGRYRLERLLGHGSWGETWLASDGATPVVLKRTGRLGPAGRHVLLAEAEALRSVRHPHVVRLLGVERVGAEPVLVLAHASGGSLEGMLGRGPAPAATVEPLLRDLLGGLQAIHDAGLVHGDVKPSNVLLEGDRALVADLGSARPRPVAGETPAPGQPATLLYRPPEQDGAGRCDARTDQYGAALVALALLWGRPPAPPERRPAAPAFPPGTPAHLRAALRRALQPDPRRRFPSCAAFARALGSAQQQQRAAHAQDVAALQAA